MYKTNKWTKTPDPPIKQKDRNLAGTIFPNLQSHSSKRYSHITRESNLESPYFLFLNSKWTSANLTLPLHEENISNNILKPIPDRLGAILSNTFLFIKIPF